MIYSQSAHMNLIDGYSHRDNTLSAVALANGKRPFASLNGRVGVIQLVPEFNPDLMDRSFTNGAFLPYQYQQILGVDKGVWTLRGKQNSEGVWQCNLTFIQTTKRDEYGKFPMIVFQGITIEKPNNQVVVGLPQLQNDDYNCLLEEALCGSTGILLPMMQRFAFAGVNPIRLKGGTVYARPLEANREATGN